MTYFDSALKEDIAGNYDKAIDYYIKSIENEEMILDSHLNLIVILIEVVFDYGITTELLNKGVFSQNDIDGFGEYLNALIKRTKVLFDSSEVRFWEYLKESYYEGIEREVIEEIIDHEPNNLVPYFQLYILDKSEGIDVVSYQSKLDALRKTLMNEPTIKNKYILSLIESAENLKI